MINQFRLYILQNFKNDDRKKDIITIVSLVFLATIIGVSLLTMEGTFSTLIDYLNLFVKEPYNIELATLFCTKFIRSLFSSKGYFISY